MRIYTLKSAQDIDSLPYMDEDWPIKIAAYSPATADSTYTSSVRPYILF